MNIKIAILEQIKRFGINLSRYPDSDLRRRITLLNTFNVTKIFDIGANIGQYSKLMKEIGFKGEIVSFEPLSAAFNKLQKESQKYKGWIAVNIALGDMDGETRINVSKNSYSSSLLDILPSHLEIAPEAVFIQNEIIRINKIDTIINKYSVGNDVIFLKIDTQGYEKNVIEGAKESMNKIIGIQLEMSLIPLYKGETLFPSMLSYMKDIGFELYSIENGFFDLDTGQLLQVDGIFFKDKIHGIT